MAVYGIDRFFNYSFELSPPSSPVHGCASPLLFDYHEIVDKLEITHYSTIGDFLALQLRVIVVNLEEDKPLPTFLEDYNIKITKSGDVLALNGVPVVFPEVYIGDTVVVHGIQKMLPVNGPSANGFSASSGFHSPAAENVIDYSAAYGKLRGGSFCDVTYVTQQQNGTPTIVYTEVCLPVIALNNITVIYEDTEAADVFDPSYDISMDLLPEEIPLSHFGCVAQFADYRFASDALKANGGSLMASFLDMQLIDIGDETKLTVFAPIDKLGILRDYTIAQGNHFPYLRYIVPCKTDLENLNEGTFKPSNSETSKQPVVLIHFYSVIMVSTDRLLSPVLCFLAPSEPNSFVARFGPSFFVVTLYEPC